MTTREERKRTDLSASSGLTQFQEVLEQGGITRETANTWQKVARVPEEIVQGLAESLGMAEVLAAEAELGEILKPLDHKPKSDSSGKGTFGGREKSLPSGITKKQSYEVQKHRPNYFYPTLILSLTSFPYRYSL